MAARRMFAKVIVDSDLFIDMPVTSRLLYYDLGMRADDDGFVNAPKKIMRMIGASQDDLKILVQRGFIIPFDSGVIVISHWRVHNYLRKDTYNETQYAAEKSQLVLDDKNVYQRTVYEPSTDCQRTVDEPWTQVREGKGREKKGNGNTISDSISCSEPLASSVPDVPALILNDNSEWRPSRDDLDGWQRLYVGVDVIRELARMREWCKSNPTKRKTRKGIRRFVQSWLDREQNRPNKYGSGSTQKDKFTQRMEDMQNWGRQFECNN